MSNALTTFFIAGDVFDTMNKSRKKMSYELNNGSNKYDDILKNKIVKAPMEDGAINAVNSNPMFRNASEEVDFLCKVASENYSNRNYHYNKNNSYYNKNKNENDKKEEINLKPIPFDDNKKNTINPYVLLGSSVLTAGAIEALIKKDIKAPLKSTKKGFNDFVYEAPRNIGEHNKVVKNVKRVIRKGTKPLRGKNNPNNGFGSMNKLAATLDKKTNLKKMFKEDFVRQGLETIPYYGAPAVAGYLISKCIAQPSSKNKTSKIVIDVPIEELQKADNQNNIDNSEVYKRASEDDLSWGDWAKYKLPSKAVQGLSKNLFPAIIVAATGRNIKGNLEKVDRDRLKNNKLPPQEPGKIRIVIDTNEPMDVKASYALDEFYKFASDAAKDADKKIENADVDKKEKEEERKTESLINYDKMRQGMLKQQRMQY